jgi:hypothetical protein
MEASFLDMNFLSDGSTIRNKLLVCQQQNSGIIGLRHEAWSISNPLKLYDRFNFFISVKILVFCYLGMQYTLSRKLPYRCKNDVRTPSRVCPFDLPRTIETLQGMIL